MSFNTAFLFWTLKHLSHSNQSLCDSLDQSEHRLVSFSSMKSKDFHILCTQTSESCRNSRDNRVKNCVFDSSQLCMLPWARVKHICTLPRLLALNLPVSCSAVFSLLSLAELLNRNKCNWIKRCVCLTNYGHLCSFYGNLCPIILWSFLHPVVLNVQHNGAYVAMACLFAFAWC